MKSMRARLTAVMILTFVFGLALQHPATAADDASDYVKQGMALYKQGKLRDASSAFEKATRLDPKSFSAHSGLGVVYYAQGKLPEAISAWQTALKINSRSASVHSNLGAALNDSGKHKDAAAECRRALKIKPKFAGAQFNLGRALYKLKDYRGAIRAFRAAVQINPKFADAWLNLGTVYAKGTGEPAEAVSAFKTFLKLVPEPDECSCWVKAYIEKHDN